MIHTTKQEGETKKTISNDEGEIDNEPVAKKSKYELGLEEHPLDKDPTFYGLLDAQSALDIDYLTVVAETEPSESLNFLLSSMDIISSKEQEIIQDPMPNQTCQTLKSPDQEFLKHQTLSEQLNFIEKQNGTIREARNISFEQMSNISTSIDTVQSNLQY
ncbi:Hypothetical predicted protein [Mytilus galloprovincialis]|uniref:Uncharacterized protein n=1 Tax=Mytilus galloprovincialis TaxID=29158 RepID=A0A8B6FEG5_MYTGA|nr:Hypothetical predicted protein [Mytilus galloprovincialis]